MTSHLTFGNYCFVGQGVSLPSSAGVALQLPHTLSLSPTYPQTLMCTSASLFYLCALAAFLPSFLDCTTNFCALSFLVHIYPLTVRKLSFLGFLVFFSLLSPLHPCSCFPLQADPPNLRPASYNSRPVNGFRIDLNARLAQLSLPPILFVRSSFKFETR